MPYWCEQCGSELKVKSKKAKLQTIKQPEKTMVKTAQLERAIANFESCGNKAAANAIRFLAYQIDAPINEDVIECVTSRAEMHLKNGPREEPNKAEWQKESQYEGKMVTTRHFENTIAFFASVGNEVGASAIRDFAHQVGVPIKREAIKRGIASRRMWFRPATAILA